MITTLILPLYVTFQERIYSVIEQNTRSHGKVVQKRSKGNDLRFQLLPNRESSTHSPESGDSNKQDGNGPLWLAVGVTVILLTKYILFSKYYIKKSLENDMTSKPKMPIESSDTETLDY